MNKPEFVFDRDEQRNVKVMWVTRSVLVAPGRYAKRLVPVGMTGREVNVCNCGEGHECTKSGYCGY